ncbi:MAG: hypothetical protein HXM02_10280 [[Eubacterium] sulci]|nr:hypothetical protein [[Eubacterium] sulci]
MNENILNELDALQKAKKQSVRILKLSLLFAGVVVLFVLLWGFSVQLTALDKVVVIDRSGEYVQTKIYNREELFSALIKNTCALATEYANSFSATDLKLNQARAHFYINKQDLNAIFAKYNNDKAYSDAVNNNVVYRTQIEKIGDIKGKNEPYAVSFTSILTVYSPSGRQQYRIHSEGELVSTTPQFPENVTGYTFSSLQQRIEQLIPDENR